MGNSNSSLNDKVNEILQETSPVAPGSGVPVAFTEVLNNKYVGETESPTSSAPLPTGPVITSPTSAEQSATSAAPVPLGINVLSATSAASPRKSHRQPGEISVSGMAFNFTGNPKDLDAAVRKALESSESQQRPQKGGYTYAGEVNSEPQIGGNTGQIYIDPSMFVSESEQVGGTNEFNPEKFFNDMQSGGDPFMPVVHRGKKAVKTGLDKTFDTTPDYVSDQDEDNFDLDEEGLEQDSDEEEDTEDVKNKVKVLRAMVARSKGKKAGKTVKGKRRHNKRMTETGGASENSVSEYLDTTSSINTSDVKLISMKRK
jgi:hypothetical protein